MIWTLRMKSHLISDRLLNIKEELTEIKEFKEPQMQLASGYLTLFFRTFISEFYLLAIWNALQLRIWNCVISLELQAIKRNRDINLETFLENFKCIPHPQSKGKAQMIKLCNTVWGIHFGLYFHCFWLARE